MPVLLSGCHTFSRRTRYENLVVAISCTVADPYLSRRCNRCRSHSALTSQHCTLQETAIRWARIKGCRTDRVLYSGHTSPMEYCSGLVRQSNRMHRAITNISTSSRNCEEASVYSPNQSNALLSVSTGSPPSIPLWPNPYDVWRNTSSGNGRYC